MKFTCTVLMSIVLLAVSLLVAPIPGNAQATPSAAAGLVAHGNVEYEGQTGVVLSFRFNLVELPNGSVNGQGRLGVNGTGFVLFKLSSFMFVDGALAMAGEITHVVGDVPPFNAVGNTIFFFVKDNDPDADEVQQGIVPPQFGNPTIQEILDAVGLPPFYQTVISGDIVIFED